ncbi:BON domain-containing protein [Legionella oakridgensis]|uniref:Putative periplasmic or secreted lipoprotein n=2 Tax=Legionella oakridgensis TaxID=29423 RepID=W0BD29_9GAMM|nr:BON domain-containing protein [Legionella oakridgensis]AHE68433.1 putative periplasmic or secreted lipoprotein [Legionella oakridgensis ATCC 33761 = DSM 21215]ETO92101.1 putative periplasmic or secreted lipoprotein [Legionella oakridgensis RV-2-2007]KTD38412.1 putative periplasmic or secreted lipoprotein [Legionella oakridgensis]STY21371.1 21 kDa hemolysin precursor [Legionella longbeachae]
MKKSTLIILCLSVLLTSCVAAVVAGAAGGLVVYDRRSMTMIERDARIFYVINKTIVSDPIFRDSHIIISSFNQIVLLAGQTPKASLRVVAEKIAKKTPNVQRVYNEITVQNPIAFSQRSKDSWITGQVRAQMLAKKGLESGSIRVVTENSVVYLMGIATHEQANLAVDVARQVNGVSKVVKIFRYIT